MYFYLPPSAILSAFEVFSVTINWNMLPNRACYLPMARRKLPNYLRTHRKRAGLLQRELALLLGCKSGAEVSRYERSTRQPTLRTALAYEAVFGTPARELLLASMQKSSGRR